MVIRIEPKAVRGHFRRFGFMDLMVIRWIVWAMRSGNYERVRQIQLEALNCLRVILAREGVASELLSDLG